MKWLIGIDETARCPALLPLYVLGVATTIEELNKMKEKVKLKDSKLTTPNQRKSAFDYVIKRPRKFKFKLVKIPPYMIDNAMMKILPMKMNLNDLETIAMYNIIEELKFQISKIDKNATFSIYINNFERKREQFIKRMKRLYLEIPKNLTLTHKYYDIISLASMLCKYIEDMETELWKQIYGFDFGSKNPNDGKTQEFVKKFPHSQIIRTKWGTIIPKILEEVKQDKRADV